MRTLGRRRFLFAVGAGAALTACGTNKRSSRSVANPTTGSRKLDALRLAGGDWGYPSPYGFVRGPGFEHMVLCFDTLVWKDSQGVIPWLATEWSAAPDGKSWTFTLRDGVKWQDGQPFTADDVVFTVDYFKSKPNPWYASQLDLIDGVQKLADNRVEFKLNQVYAPFLTSVGGSLVIIPQHIWQGVDDPKKFTDNRAVIGTGPYRMTDYNKEQGSYRFEANPNFFLGAPYVQRLDFVPAPDVLLALQKGDIDAGGPGVQDAVSPDTLAQFKDAAKWGSIQAPGEWTMGFYFNLEKGGALADPAFRQAVAHAVDRDALVQRILQENGQPGNPGFLPPANPWHTDSVTRYPHDLAKAKSLLDAHGYADHGGMRQEPDGKPLQFELMYASNDSPRNAELIQGSLKELGVGVTIKAVDQATRDAAAVDGRYDLILTGFGGLGSDPDNMRTIFDSKSKSRSFTRVRGYANAEFNDLAEQQLHTVDDKQRHQLVDKMQTLVAQDIPMFGLYYPTRYHFHHKGGLENWYFTPGGFGGGVPTANNKQLFVVGQKTGIKIGGG